MFRLNRIFRNAEEPLVKVTRKNAVALLTLNRPKALNALNVPLAQAIAGNLKTLDADDSVRAFVITGEGKAFVAGADIKMMQPMQFTDWNSNDLFKDFEVVRTIRKPIIAAVNGFALGGGCELAMLCDIIIASEKAMFGQPEIKLGTIPGLGGTQRLTRLIGKTRAMEWVLTGNHYSAKEALEAGLVSRVVAPEKLLETAMDMAELISNYSAVTVQLAKDCVNRSQEMSLAESLQYEKRTFHSTFATKDQKEGMAAFAEKRKANFEHK